MSDVALFSVGCGVFIIVMGGVFLSTMLRFANREEKQADAVASQ